MQDENSVELTERHESLSFASSPQSLYFDRANSMPALHVLAEHGPLVDHDIHPLVDTVPLHPELWWSRVRAICWDAFSEFFGVFILILFGDGVVAQVVLSNEQKGN